jgi:hypothetical protein
MSKKACVHCKEVWPSDGEFYKSAKSEMCLACEHETARWRKYRTPEHLAKRREYQRLVKRNMTPEQREQKNRKDREHRARQKQEGKVQHEKA